MIGEESSFKEKPKRRSVWKWILGVVLVLVVILFGLTAYSGYQNDKRKIEQKANGTYTQDEGKKFNSRIVKTFTPESGAAFKYASPMLDNDHIYIGTSERIGYDNAPVAKGHDNFFYKFDLDFNVKWQYPLQKKMVAGGAVMDSNRNLYFVTELLNDKNNADKKEQIFATVYLMSLTEEGKLRWEKQIGANEELWDHGFLTPAIADDDTIYVGNDRFYAFDVDGNQLAKYPTDDNKRTANYGGAPVIDSGGNVYFTSPEPVTATNSTDPKKQASTDVIMAYKFGPKLSLLTWSTVMGNEMLENEGGNANGGGGQKSSGIESPPALGVGGKSLYGIVGNTISKIDTATGKLLWSLKPDGATGHINASPAIDGEDNLYVGTKSNMESRFYAISSTGKQLWRTEIGSDLYNHPILTNDGNIYVGSETNPKGKFHVLDRKTGKEQETYFTDDERKVPDFSHDGMLLYKGYVYVGVHSAVEGEEENAPLVPTLYKIKVDANNYLPGAAWPRIHGGNSNKGGQD